MRVFDYSRINDSLRNNDVCNLISEITVERTLRQLLEEGYIQKLGGGRGTAYAKRM